MVLTAGSASPSLLAGMPVTHDHVDATGLSAERLWPFLAMAAHEPDAETARKVEYLQRFLREWPRRGDIGIAALDETGSVMGAAWARSFDRTETDFHVADGVPELVLAVRADRRGEGLGRRLLDELEVMARASNFAGLCLTVREDNPACSLYRQAGFVTCGRGRNRVGTMSLGMWKPLDTDAAEAGATKWIEPMQ